MERSSAAERGTDALAHSRSRRPPAHARRHQRRARSALQPVASTSAHPAEQHSGPTSRSRAVGKLSCSPRPALQSLRCGTGANSRVSKPLAPRARGPSLPAAQRILHRSSRLECEALPRFAQELPKRLAWSRARAALPQQAPRGMQPLLLLRSSVGVFPAMRHQSAHRRAILERPSTSLFPRPPCLLAVLRTASMPQASVKPARAFKARRIGNWRRGIV